MFQVVLCFFSQSIICGKSFMLQWMVSPENSTLETCNKTATEDWLVIDVLIGIPY